MLPIFLITGLGSILLCSNGSLELPVGPDGSVFCPLGCAGACIQITGNWDSGEWCSFVVQTAQKFNKVTQRPRGDCAYMQH